jgi:hypothetical protein
MAIVIFRSPNNADIFSVVMHNNYSDALIEERKKHPQMSGYKYYNPCKPNFKNALENFFNELISAICNEASFQNQIGKSYIFNIQPYKFDNIFKYMYQRHNGPEIFKEVFVGENDFMDVAYY